VHIMALVGTVASSEGGGFPALATLPIMWGEVVVEGARRRA
jgi:hypothetical protein